MRDLAAWSVAHEMDYRFNVKTHERGEAEITASRTALVQYAQEIVALARDGVEGSHLHFDEAGWAEVGSVPLIIGLAVDTPEADPL
ncbi:hypothetical protein [Brevundimonas sp. A19_0]|uniref:Imm32 family immunity protein n=1 Tax=Brevundimonas sp. A19_0 TaxID=2821087 RepID=UPI001ADB17A5|nr:hypothetical protein [Brevundimonas sp. A19_0]MBO9500082.1 hypothetical protein [Brevundimonas sp. A19_0]